MIFWRSGLVWFSKAAKWDVEAAPEGEDWRAEVVVRSRRLGRRRTAEARLLHVVREVEARVADEVMGVRP